MIDKQKPHLIDPTGRQHPLQNNNTIIGRAVENDIVITSKRVSREHTQIRRDGWRIYVEDMGSTNGTIDTELASGTLTLDANLAEYLLVRLEGRADVALAPDSHEPFYSGIRETAPNQYTATLGVVASSF
jgi:hypothetical protein